MPLEPVNVIFGDIASLQTVVVPLIVAAGKELTITVALPVCSWEQAVELASWTLTRA